MFKMFITCQHAQTPSTMMQLKGRFWTTALSASQSIWMMTILWYLTRLIMRTFMLHHPRLMQTMLSALSVGMIILTRAGFQWGTWRIPMVLGLLKTAGENHGETMVISMFHIMTLWFMVLD